MSNNSHTKLSDYLIYFKHKQFTGQIDVRGNGIIDRVRAKVSGASAFVSKPIEIDKIIDTIDKHLTPKSTRELKLSTSTELAK